MLRTNQLLEVLRTGGPNDRGSDSCQRPCHGDLSHAYAPLLGNLFDPAQTLIKPRPHTQAATTNLLTISAVPGPSK
jgi:hypothetical protein